MLHGISILSALRFAMLSSQFVWLSANLTSDNAVLVSIMKRK